MLLDKCKLCIEQVKNVIPMTILGFPSSSGLESCHDYVMLRPRYVECILGNAVLDFPLTAMTRIRSEAYNKLG
jgi:hypothetical protein